MNGKSSRGKSGTGTAEKRGKRNRGTFRPNRNRKYDTDGTGIVENIRAADTESNGSSNGSIVASQGTGDQSPSGRNPNHDESNGGDANISSGNTGATTTSGESDGSGNRQVGGSVGSSGGSNSRERRRLEREQRRLEQQRRTTDILQRADDEPEDDDNPSDQEGDQGNSIVVKVTNDKPAPGTATRSTRKNTIKKPQTYKEPSKSNVDITSSSLQDVYEVIDTLADLAFKATGKEYPEGALKLDDQTSKKLAKSLNQLNSALPQLAAQTQKFTAPTTLISTLLLDSFMKGAILYGAWKSQSNPKRTVTSIQDYRAESRHVNGQDTQQPTTLSQNGAKNAIH